MRLSGSRSFRYLFGTMAFRRVGDTRGLINWINNTPAIFAVGCDAAAAHMTGGAKSTLIRRASIVPAHLFGPEHSSLKYGRESDRYNGQSCAYEDKVITNEINR